MHTNHYVVTSLELHLFFGRIMKEHALFLRAGFTPAASSYSAKAELYMKEFEELLSRAVSLSDGIISREVLSSGEVITEYTAMAEDQTECLTGIQIDKTITQRQQCLNSGICPHSQDLQRQVRQLNRRALQLLDGLISFKETILQNVLQGDLFTVNYPLLIEHIIREAKLYRKYLKMLERDGKLAYQSMKEIECFWNQIMMEHAQFIRGLLDPCETELFKTADEFSKKYCKLLEDSRNAHCRTITDDSLAETIKFRDFKASGTQGIQQCKIRSIILPLLADHVLREANHYIRLLKD
ncbi:MAG: DUF2935 domain-containing protein [Oscillospiraceae bacterium]|nr:DUF2935 domain-containing protein [Oscillospiraceae bacterium]